LICGRRRGFVFAAGADLKINDARGFEDRHEAAADGSELSAMLFGWRVVKHVKSNAIVYAARTGRSASARDR
jgi:AICAR transformylase/IMP cyclohydrolase PurH